MQLCEVSYQQSKWKTLKFYIIYPVVFVFTVAAIFSRISGGGLSSRVWSSLG